MTTSVHKEVSRHGAAGKRPGVGEKKEADRAKHKQSALSALPPDHGGPNGVAAAARETARVDGRMVATTATEVGNSRPTSVAVPCREENRTR